MERNDRLEPPMFMSEHERFEHGNLPRETPLLLPENVSLQALRRMIEKDDHHTMSQAKVHSVYEVYRSIRENSSMIAHGMARAAHVLTHAETAHVPLVDYYTALRVANRLPAGLFVLDGIDEFCRLVEEANHHPKIKPREVELNEVVVRTVRDQIPYIIDGYPSTRTIVA